MKTNQKEAVFHAITSVLTESSVDFSEGLDVATVMTRELRAQVNEILFNGFRNGGIELDREFNDTELKGYVSGLQSNWIRKDKRLNGGVAYMPKNPGSRAGSGDSQLKALRALLKTQVDPVKIDEIMTYINKRTAEIGAAKAKTVEVNFSDLPADLQAKYGS
jgi:hypothetical protein